MVGENILIMIFHEIEMHIYIAIVPISYFEFSRHYFEFKSSQLAFPGGRAQYAMSAVDFFW